MTDYTTPLWNIFKKHDRPAPPMIDEFREMFSRRMPAVLRRIDRTISGYPAGASPVEAFGFPRLPLFYPADLLRSARVVLVDAIPPLPRFLSDSGLFGDLFDGSIAAITFRNTYFLRRGLAGHESVHFHELVHVVQWRHLGPEKFLRLYAYYLIKNGYRTNPFEEMAYGHQNRFDLEQTPYDVQAEVIRELDRF